MSQQESLQPGNPPARSMRARLNWKGELMLALAPTITILLVLALVENFSHQRLLFASLASSAFLIYLDPQHGTNSVRTLVLSQSAAAILGFAAFSLLGAGYGAAALSIVGIIVLMIVCDAVHPPAVSTALSFAFRASNENNLLLFALALGCVVLLVVLQRASVWLLARLMGARDVKGGQSANSP
ncbi:MAG: HPP family protein [Armatimonadetes bacterium]|nr:HPP family protein [Armatimonadota bacterium]